MRPCCRSGSHCRCSPPTHCPRWPTHPTRSCSPSSLAGLAAYSFSWKIALLVAVVMLVVVASYRQNVHAYPSGGGDYEVATVNLGPNAGLTVASALLVDYVLTVAVSISSGVQNAKSVLPFLQGNEALAASIAVLVLMAMNLRGVTRVRRVLRHPHLLLHHRNRRHGRLRAVPHPGAGRDHHRAQRAVRHRARPGLRRPSPGSP